jgi:putative protease
MMRGNRATFSSKYLVEKAKRHPADEAYLKQQLNRLGGTPYQLNHLSLDLPEGVMIPASELNAGRRYLVDQISNKRLKKYRHPAVTDDHLNKEWHALLPEKKKEKESGNLKISVRVAGYEGARAAMEAGADVIYLGGESFCSRESDQWMRLIRLQYYAKKKAGKLFMLFPIFSIKGKENHIQ